MDMKRLFIVVVMVCGLMTAMAQTKQFCIAKDGKHRLKIIMIDPEIVIEQIVVNPDNNCYSYFGR